MTERRLVRICLTAPSQYFQCSAVVAPLRDDTLQNLAFVIYAPQKIVALTIDLHGRKHWAEPVHQNRMVSWPKSMPRSCCRSSTFLSDDGNRT